MDYTPEAKALAETYRVSLQTAQRWCDTADKIGFRGQKRKSFLSNMRIYSENPPGEKLRLALSEFKEELTAPIKGVVKTLERILGQKQ